MERHEEQKIINRSIKEFTDKGYLITFDFLFKKDEEKKKRFEDFYKKNKSEIKTPTYPHTTPPDYSVLAEHPPESVHRNTSVAP